VGRNGGVFFFFVGSKREKRIAKEGGKRGKQREKGINAVHAALSREEVSAVNRAAGPRRGSSREDSSKHPMKDFLEWIRMDNNNPSGIFGETIR